MALTTADALHAATDSVDDRAALHRHLARLQRVSRWKAIALIAPLFVFLLLVFVVPIALLLTRAVDNREVAAVLPKTSIAMKTWQGDGAPTPALADALVADLRTSPREAVAEVAKRLNYYQSGLRSVVLKTAREVNRDGPAAGAGLERLKEIDERWAEPATWSVIQRALPASTDFYMLASVDLRRDAQGNIVAASDDNAIYRDVIARTFAISAVGHADLPAARLSARVLDRHRAAAHRTPADAAGAAAVLDLAAGAHHRLGRPAARRRRGQQPARLARPGRSGRIRWS